MDTNATLFRGNRSNLTCSRDNVVKTVVFPILYSILFLAGLSLNGLAMWVFLRIPSRSHFVIYLKNVVVADVVMTLTFPFKVLSDSNMASTGLRIFVCRVSSVLFYLTMYISILFFGLISIDRCRKTLAPFKGTNATRLARRKFLSTVVWVVLLVLCLPNVILTELYKSYSRTKARGPEGCRASAKPKQHAKRKMNTNVFLVLAVFFVCFVPFHFARVPYTMSQTRGLLFDCRLKLFFFQLKESTLFLSSLNSLLDPLIYFFLCKSFRTTLFKTLRLPPGTCSWLLERGSDTDSSSTTLRDSSLCASGGPSRR
ncbi:P2Y purinoceptor 12 isoform X2 [Phyllopteryx taeniolatus]|uniref:P2Y purinoceptor 12 isoform X2 n=1 Tax=Phyllopteryx taeniolatus TaxID=161469 RepID=UPI002AD3AC32|nr:P2Y purinoceptor 12 isoform X2 [Phyllopteryx taeniolatus]